MYYLNSLQLCCFSSCSKYMKVIHFSTICWLLKDLVLCVLWDWFCDAYASFDNIITKNSQVVPIHAIKTYKGNRGVAVLLHNLGCHWWLMLLYDNQNFLKNHTSQIIAEIILTHTIHVFIGWIKSACAPAAMKDMCDVTVAAIVSVQYLWLQLMLEVSRNGHVTAVTYPT